MIMPREQADRRSDLDVARENLGGSGRGRQTSLAFSSRIDPLAEAPNPDALLEAYRLDTTSIGKANVETSGRGSGRRRGRG